MTDLPPPEPPKTFTLYVDYTDSGTRYFNSIVSFEPAENAYLAIDDNGKRIVIPFAKIDLIEVWPDE